MNIKKLIVESLIICAISYLLVSLIHKDFSWIIISSNPLDIVISILIVVVTFLFCLAINVFMSSMLDKDKYL